MRSTWMQTEWNYLRAIQRNVESRISAGAPNKLPGCEEKKNTRKNSCVVLRHGRTCTENALRHIVGWQIGRRSNCAKFQVLLGWSSCREGGSWISWRIIRSMRTDCLEMLLRGTNWWTRHFIVSGDRTTRRTHNFSRFLFVSPAHRIVFSYTRTCVPQESTGLKLSARLRKKSSPSSRHVTTGVPHTSS